MLQNLVVQSALESCTPDCVIAQLCSEREKDFSQQHVRYNQSIHYRTMCKTDEEIRAEVAAMSIKVDYHHACCTDIEISVSVHLQTGHEGVLVHEQNLFH